MAITYTDIFSKYNISALNEKNKFVFWSVLFSFLFQSRCASGASSAAIFRQFYGYVFVAGMFVAIALRGL